MYNYAGREELQPAEHQVFREEQVAGKGARQGEERPGIRGVQVDGIWTEGGHQINQ